MSKTGTFLVTDADAESAVLRDVHDGQVVTLGGNADPALDEGEVVDATVEATPPLEVTWRVEAVADRRRVAVERVDDRPADRAFDAVAGRDPGEAVVVDGAGETAGDENGDGDEEQTAETHVFAVPVDRTAEVADEVADDEATLVRAARLGSRRVEVRGADGVVTVAYR